MKQPFAFFFFIAKFDEAMTHKVLVRFKKSHAFVRTNPLILILPVPKQVHTDNECYHKNGKDACTYVSR